MLGPRIVRLCLRVSRCTGTRRGGILQGVAVSSCGGVSRACPWGAAANRSFPAGPEHLSCVQCFEAILFAAFLSGKLGRVPGRAFRALEHYALPSLVRRVSLIGCLRAHALAHGRASSWALGTWQGRGCTCRRRRSIVTPCKHENPGGISPGFDIESAFSSWVAELGAHYLVFVDQRNERPLC